MLYDPSLEPVLKRIGERLWQARHANKEKIAAVAKGIGINISVVSQVENGRYHPLSLDLLSRFAHYYHTPLDLLLAPDISLQEPGTDNQALLIQLLIAENAGLKQRTDNKGS